MRASFKDPDSILITGASSGIGAALARAYARPGARLELAGRDRGRLEDVARVCRDRGAEADAEAVDVTDAEAMGRWIAAADARRPLALVIANAGISAGPGSGAEDAERVRAVFAVNLDGVLNTVLPAIPPLCRRGHGQIAIISSLAGYLGLPGSPAYAASKAAVKAYAEGLRGLLAGDGIGVSAVCPGFVATPMTAANPFPMPGIMDADRAAAIIRRGLAHDRARIAFPWHLAAIMGLLAALPAGLSDRLLRAMPRKD